MAYATSHALDGIRPTLRDSVDPDGVHHGQLANYQVPLSVHINLVYDPLYSVYPYSIHVKWRTFDLGSDDPAYLQEHAEESYEADDALAELTFRGEGTSFGVKDGRESVLRNLEAILRGTNTTKTEEQDLGGIVSSYMPGLPLDLGTLRGILASRSGCVGRELSTSAIHVRRWMHTVGHTTDTPLVDDPDTALSLTDPLEAATRAIGIENGEFNREEDEEEDEEVIDATNFLPEIHYIGEVVSLLRLLTILDVLIAADLPDLESYGRIVRHNPEVNGLQATVLRMLMNVAKLIV